MTQTMPKPDGRVISLARYKLMQRHRILTDLLDRWNSLRPQGGLPARADLNPRDIALALDYTFVLERVSPGVVRFRVAGGHLAHLMGMDLRGMPVTALAQAAHRDMLAAQLDRVFDIPATLEMQVSRPDLRADLLILPLHDAEGCVTQATGALVARDDPAGPMPADRRFALSAQRLTPVAASEKTAQSQSFAEPSAPFQTAPPKGRGHLKLVKG